MHVDFTDLRLFVAACDTGSITAGAERVHLTLASASERIRDIEADLGVPLLVRERRGVRPTPAGRAFLLHARELLAQVGRMRGDLGAFVDGSRGQVRLLCNTAGLADPVPHVLSEFLAAEPRVSVELEERTSPRIDEALHDGACDLGVLSDGADLHGLACFEIRPDPLALVVPAAHRLAARRSVALADVVDEPFVGLPPGSALDELVMQQARRLGRRLDHRVRIAGFESMCRLIGAGIGVGVIPRAIARRHLRTHGIRCIALADGWADRRLMVCVRRLDDLPAHAQTLVERLRRNGAQSPR